MIENLMAEEEDENISDIHEFCQCRFCQCTNYPFDETDCEQCSQGTHLGRKGER